MGFLLEKSNEEPAGIDDLPSCEALLQRIYRHLRLLYEDVNRYNFLVVRVSGSGVCLVDFEHADVFDDEARAEKELQSLPAELTEDTGRGASRAYQD